jgi:ATP-dependent Clp protease protease subunit
MRRLWTLGALTVASLVVGSDEAAAEKKPDPGVILLTNRFVDLSGTIAQGMITKAQNDLFDLENQSNDPIWLRINSGGGSVEAGLILIDTIKALKSPVFCLVESKAYSMAAIMLVFCDKKYAFEHATIMLHEASYGTMGEDPSNRSRLDFLTRYLDRLHEEIATRIKRPHAEYRPMIRDGWWLLADEAVKAGIIDAIVTSITYRELTPEQTEDKRTFNVQETDRVVPEHLLREKIPKRK